MGCRNGCKISTNIFNLNAQCLVIFCPILKGVVDLETSDCYRKAGSRKHMGFPAVEVSSGPVGS